MTRLTVVALVIASAVGAALLTSRITVKWHQEQAPKHQHSEETEQDFHTWLHTNLDLTEAQLKALRPIEDKFATQQQEARAEITKAADELAHLISHHDQSHDDIAKALDRLNQAQAHLQKLSLAHFLEMKKELTPEQAQEILRWTHDSIVGDHSH